MTPLHRQHIGMDLAGSKHMSAVAAPPPMCIHPLPVLWSMRPRDYSVGARHGKGSMVAKLAPEGKIDPHVDQGESFATSHRIHVPLQTNPGVQFKINGRSFHLEEGIAYEVSNLDPHAVANRGLRDRLHFIFDYAVQ